MLVTLVCEQKIFSLHLPEKIAGKYWILDEDKPMSLNRILSIEADNSGEKWIVRADRKRKLYDEYQKEIQCLELEEGGLYPIQIGAGAGLSFLFAETFTENRGIYKKYALNGDATLNIGREGDNDVVISNSYVSSHHATLSLAGGKWTLCDNNSTNGTYVNKHRIYGQVNLNVGDMVFVMGFKFTVGDKFISMNNPDESIRIHTTVLTEMLKNKYVDDEQLVLEDVPYYYRSPRFVRKITPFELQVDSPTRREDRENTPILLTVGPSLVMGVASFAVGIFSIVNAMNNDQSLLTTIPTMVTAIAMLLGMILFPVIMRKRERKISLEREKERREKYLKYLNNLRQEIQKNITVQEEILKESNPPVMQLCAQPEFWDHRLWSKTTTQHDFLYLRLGAGNMPMIATIKFPEDRFTIGDDTLRDSLLAFQREERILMNVPVGVSLLKSRVLGIVGDRGGVFNLLCNILAQITLLHSYDEVKLICIYEESEEKYLSFIHYVQHIWDDEGKRRYLAVTEDNLRELSIDISKILVERREIVSDQEKAPALPHYIVVCASKSLANKCTFLSDILEDSKLKGFSVICAYDEMKSLPKECGAVVWANGEQGLLYDALTGEKVNFEQDAMPADIAESIIRNMTDKKLDLNRGRFALPEMLTFMDMFGVNKCEHLNILQRWKTNNPVKSLRTPVGVDTNGETFYLDLHEKFHGPHGLIAGMTGSGKSEFIITYILSLAINYHPDEVAFVLIDYKGGGLTGAFENEHYTLPHLAGTITNLDGGTIMRSILSIKSELRRRQAIFNNARNVANEGTMDIYKYQKMYRDGQVSEPMPHLFIISDEFAELKSQQPEFMDQLISTARIGRSLGVHLILATQKPGGVVNEQIWANSRFKVCLKVQDRTDSNDMLKRPDAAEIAETGRFYLQVGYNELFEMGQSAWTGAAYRNSDISENESDVSIEILDELGNVVDRLKGKKPLAVKNNGRQIVKIMEYLDKLAREEKLHERPLWMPEIPADIRVDALIEKYQYKTYEESGLHAVIGELDDPYTQSQRILDVNFTEVGNVLIYGAAGSGKEMMLNTILYSLYKDYTPAQLNAYILDFGTESLKMFESAPHTGSVMIDGESEKIQGFISMFDREVKHRKKLLAEFGGDMARYNASGNEKIPYFLVIINNYSNFYENYERFEDALITLTRECPKYGMYFVVTATNTMAVRYRMLQNFRQLYVMQMNDKADYSTVLGNTGGVFPSAIKGRGIIKTEETYVFQTAGIVGKREDLLKYIKQFATDLTQKAGDVRAKQIPVVPKFVSGLDAANNMNSFEQVPLGISYASYDYLKINMVEKNILLTIAEDPKAALNYAGGMVETMSTVSDLQVIVFNGGKELKEKLDVAYEAVDGDYEAKIVELFQTAVLRNNNYKDTNGQPTVDMTPMLIVLNGYERLKNTLSEDGKDKLITILDKVEGFCNMFFIVSDGYRYVNQYYMDRWIGNRCGGEGVWVGNGIDDQMRLPINRKSRELSKEIDVKTGYYVSDGNAKLMRLVMPSGLEVMFENER